MLLSVSSVLSLRQIIITNHNVGLAEEPLHPDRSYQTLDVRKHNLISSSRLPFKNNTEIKEYIFYGSLLRTVPF